MQRAFTITIALISLLLASSALAGPHYINSKGQRVELTPAVDLVAVHPMTERSVDDYLSLRTDIAFSSATPTPTDLILIPVTAEYRGSVDSIIEQLLDERLVDRVGMVFMAEGQTRPVILDRQVIVKLEKPSLNNLPFELLEPTGLEPILALGHEGTTFLCRAPNAKSALAGSVLASNLDGVSWALPDFIVPVTLHYQPTDPYYDQQWHHQQASGAHIYSEEAWDITTGDEQVIVAVIDTGVEESHPDFNPDRIVTGYNYTNPPNDPTPLAGPIDAHGTCCAGEITAVMDNDEGLTGVCPECSLMGVRIMQGEPASMVEISNAYMGIQYAADNGAWVLSNSWGIDQAEIGSVDMEPFYEAVRDAVDNGRCGAGAVVLFASGNGDWMGNAQQIGADELANMPEAMAVGGTGHLDTRVSYSDYGPNLSVVAPTGGSDPTTTPQILTTDTLGIRGFSRNGTYWTSMFGMEFDMGYPELDNTGNYTKYFNGTSAACPIAAGVVALVFSANPYLTGVQARLVVEQTADKVGGVTYDANGHHDYYGHGRVNVGRAVRAAAIGFDNAGSSQCAEDFNCSSELCTKTLPDDHYGTCEAVDCSTSPDGEPCNDSDACTENDVCDSGLCAGTPFVCADDANPCTDDACDPVLGCAYLANFSACDDSDICTENDACVPVSTCEKAACLGEPIDCDDLNECTDDTCDPVNGCASIPNSATCDDGDPCTENDACAAGSCSGTAIDCDDNNPCTDEGACDPVLGCEYTANNEACDDLDACTENDVCSGMACAGTAVVCDDNNPCTDDSCDSISGCVFIPNIDACDDSDPCTENDVCLDGTCAGTALVCDDDNQCTDDTCDPVSGCVSTNNTSQCVDGDVCTENDTCSEGVCSGTAIVCEDMNPCTDDACVPGEGCAFVPNTLPCDDLDACTESDTCSEGICQGSFIGCDDDNPCTADSCDPATGCTNTPTSESCDDGDPCTESDTCSDGACVGTALDCSSLSGTCTVGACDPNTGTCETAAVDDGTACDDGDECTGEDVCLAGLCIGSTDECVGGGGCGCSTQSKSAAPIWLGLLLGLALVLRRRPER